MSHDKPKPIPRKTPGGSKSTDGMTMREKIAARRRAELEGQDAAPAKPAAKAAPKASPKRSPLKAAAAPVKKAPIKKAAAPVKKAPIKKAAARVEAKVEEAVEEIQEKATKPARAGRSSRPSSRSGAKRAGAGRSRRGGDDGDDDNGGTTRGRRGRPAPKKKSPIPLIAAGVLVLGGGGAYLAGVFDPAQAEASEKPEDTAGVDPAAADAPAADGATTDGDAAPDAPAAADDAETAAGDGATDAAPAADDAAPAPKKPKAAEGPGEDIDLSALEPFGKPEGASDEDWVTLQEKAAVFFDPDAGAAGNRARTYLEAQGKLAWPAIINELIKLDPADPDQNRTGMVAQRALSAARGSDTSHAFDWRTAQDSSEGTLTEKDLRYNKKLIRSLHQTWAKVVADPAHWEKVDMSDQAKEAQEKAKEKLAEDDEFSDIDVDDIDVDAIID